MKKIGSILIFMMVLISCLKESQTQYSIDEDQVFLVITQNTTKEELAKIAAELKQKKNIDIEYSNSKFKASGKISELKLEVDCNDGFKGSTHCSGNTLKFPHLGYLRDYRADRDEVFHIGVM